MVENQIVIQEEKQELIDLRDRNRKTKNRKSSLKRTENNGRKVLQVKALLETVKKERDWLYLFPPKGQFLRTAGIVLEGKFVNISLYCRQ